MVCSSSRNGYSALVVCSMDRAKPPMSINLRIQQLPSLVQEEYAMVGGESSSKGNDSNYQIMYVPRLDAFSRSDNRTNSNKVI